MNLKFYTTGSFKKLIKFNLSTVFQLLNPLLSIVPDLKIKLLQNIKDNSVSDVNKKRECEKLKNFFPVHNYKF